MATGASAGEGGPGRGLRRKVFRSFHCLALAFVLVAARLGLSAAFVIAMSPGNDWHQAFDQCRSTMRRSPRRCDHAEPAIPFRHRPRKAGPHFPKQYSPPSVRRKIFQLGRGPHDDAVTPAAHEIRPPHYPVPVPVLTVPGAAGAKANSWQSWLDTGSVFAAGGATTSVDPDGDSSAATLLPGARAKTARAVEPRGAFGDASQREPLHRLPLRVMLAARHCGDCRVSQALHHAER